VSRGFVEEHGLAQTAQSSDQVDKKYGIWHRIFLDHVDIHERAGRTKGPNQYGPVLFIFALDILLGLPDASDVLVTKKNPVYWQDNEPDGMRCFQNLEELAKNIRYGEFSQMLMIQIPSGKLDFPNRQARIVLDDPQRHLSSGDDAYTHAENRLGVAAAAGAVEASIKRRTCWSTCSCVKKYATHDASQIESYFA
jgi:hypothetical protein